MPASCCMASITVRNVPDDVRDELAARARRSGRSLQELLRAELTVLARRPDPADLMTRVRERKDRLGSALPPSAYSSTATPSEVTVVADGPTVVAALATGRDFADTYTPIIRRDTGGRVGHACGQPAIPDPPMYAPPMTDSTRTLLREALALPRGERADLVAELLMSLESSTSDDPAAVQASWAREIERRARRVLAGESTGEDWAQVRERVARRLTEK